jgi:hypothetical protein
MSRIETGDEKLHPVIDEGSTVIDKLETKGDAAQAGTRRGHHATL